jgi:hypothetical protein
MTTPLGHRTISLKDIRRLLEKDLQLEGKALDPVKRTVEELVDKV